MTDLWPTELATEVGPRAPVAILKEQAALLGKKTENIVEASVKSQKFLREPERPFAYDFYIVSKPLDYRYKIFSLYHGFEPYPVYFGLDTDIIGELSLRGPEDLSAGSEEELISILSKILQSEKIKKVIATMLAYAKAEAV